MFLYLCSLKFITLRWYLKAFKLEKLKKKVIHDRTCSYIKKVNRNYLIPFYLSICSFISKWYFYYIIFFFHKMIDTADSEWNIKGRWVIWVVPYIESKDLITLLLFFYYQFFPLRENAFGFIFGFHKLIRTIQWQFFTKKFDCIHSFAHLKKLKKKIVLNPT